MMLKVKNTNLPIFLLQCELLELDELVERVQVGDQDGITAHSLLQGFKLTPV